MKLFAIISGFWGRLTSRTKDIAITAAIIIILLIGFKATAWGYDFINRFKTKQFVFTSLQENSPIAEMATRRFKWSCLTKDEGAGKTKVVGTVYVVKIGFDFAAIPTDAVVIDPEKKTVEMQLPPLKVISVDTTLGRQIIIDKESFFRRLSKNETGVPSLDIREFCNFILDVEDNDLLDAKLAREGLEKFIGEFLKHQFGYSCTFKTNKADQNLDKMGTKEYEARVEEIFASYLTEKGINSSDFNKHLQKTKAMRQKQLQAE